MTAERYYGGPLLRYGGKVDIDALIDEISPEIATFKAESAIVRFVQLVVDQLVARGILYLEKDGT